MRFLKLFTLWYLSEYIPRQNYKWKNYVASTELRYIRLNKLKNKMIEANILLSSNESMRRKNNLCSCSYLRNRITVREETESSFKWLDKMYEFGLVWRLYYFTTASLFLLVVLVQLWASLFELGQNSLLFYYKGNWRPLNTAFLL